MNILVLEDAPATRAWIAEYLHERLHHHAFEPSRARRGAYGVADRDLYNSGLASHLLPESWKAPHHADYDIVVPDTDAVKALADNPLEPGALDKLYSFVDGRDADILIVDLALNQKQQEDLVRVGGNRVPRDDGYGWCDPDNPDVILGEPDCEQEINDLAGYQILGQCASNDKLVIVTTYMRNPIVRSRCIENGAFAVVPKPFKSDQMDFMNGVTPLELEFRTRTGQPPEGWIAPEGVDPRAFPLINYLLTISAEVLKAMVRLAVVILESTPLPDLPKAADGKQRLLRDHMSTDVIENMRRANRRA